MTPHVEQTRAGEAAVRPDDLEPALPELKERSRQYVPDLEPLVARIAPSVGDDRALLGRLCDLLPSESCSAQQLSPEDRAWLLALEQVAHRHQLSYELITCMGAEDSIYLVPAH